jgi:poly-beta-1,6-N-acetyl-D-glucosamine synthase
MLWKLLTILIALGFSQMLFNSILTIIYDLKNYNNPSPTKSIRSRWPSITVLVPAYNEESGVVATLVSLLASNYDKFKVVVVSDGSSDKTAAVVRKFIKDTGCNKVRLVELRNNRGRGGALQYGFENYVNTELVMTLDADGSIPPDTLKKISSKFRRDKYLSALSPNVRILNDSSLLGYLQMLDFIVGFRSKKAHSQGNFEFVVGGHGAIYRTSVLTKIGGFSSSMLTEDIDASLRLALHGNKFHRIRYDADILVFTESVPTVVGLYKQRYRWKLGALQAIYKYRELVFSPSKKYSKALSWYKLPMALLAELMLIAEPFILLSFLLFSILLGNLTVFFTCYLTLSFVMILSVLADEHLGRRDRTQLLLFALVAYPFFYMMTVINVIAIYKTIKNRRKVTGKDVVRGTWISPVRRAVAVPLSA